VCEPALAQGVPGFSLLSARHGEGAAAQSLELSSQSLVPFEMSLECLPAKGDSRNFSIERPVLLPSMMAMTPWSP
jgi:hypothetical protein